MCGMRKFFADLDAVVKYSLPKCNKTIMANQYKLYLPSELEF